MAGQRPGPTVGPVAVSRERCGSGGHQRPWISASTLPRLPGRRPNGEEKTSTGLIRIAPGFDGRPALLWGRPAGGKQYVAALQGETSVVWTPDTGHGFVWHRVAGDDARTPVIDGGPAQFVAV
mmetsp:Transcript_126539/g.405070  ORF Transcript_126539/g.405070 Transcript_126539/m.405070 type:complete len:123 (-) Transcript_126539:48-416(-)